MSALLSSQRPCYRGRFAPSPSGELHVGNLRTGLLAYLHAKANHGEFVIRVEDIDDYKTREVGFAQLESLKAIGLTWDAPPIWQSPRTVIHQAFIQALTDLHLTFPCFCSRKDVIHAPRAPHEPPGIYPGTCLRLSPDDVAKKRATHPRSPAIRVRAHDFAKGRVDPKRILDRVQTLLATLQAKHDSLLSEEIATQTQHLNSQIGVQTQDSQQAKNRESAVALDRDIHRQVTEAISQAQHTIALAQQVIPDTSPAQRSFSQCTPAVSDQHFSCPEPISSFGYTIVDEHYGMQPGIVDNFVLQRFDGTPAYNLTVVVDDFLDGITHVVRGADLLPSTQRQSWLTELVGLPRFAYAHVPLVVNSSGVRLAKRDGAVTVSQLAEVGVSLDDVVKDLVRSLGPMVSPDFIFNGSASIAELPAFVDFSNLELQDITYPF